VALAGHDDAGTRAHILLPHPGIYDRQAVQDMLDAAGESLAEAGERLEAATTYAA
jgi:hypothetical protein